ncbi:MAG: hypothetical protein IKF00_01325 [Solobacterium sp.]|nr:hypothetical protein [Solobacterium sp.]
MSKKNRKRAIKPEVEKETDYYDLKKEAIQALAEADESNSPEVSEEELRKYTSAKYTIPQWVKALLIKFWFAGAVCFFFIWGLGIYMADVMDTLFVTGVAMGIVTDLLTNNTLRFIEKIRGENERFIMVTKRGYASFILNILYSCFVLFFVYMLYSFINGAVASATNQPDRVVLGVEPILFGVFYLAFDLLFIEIKHFITDRFISTKKA